MNAKLTVFIVFTALLSIFLWGISLYNDWFNEAFLFGYNVYNGLLNKNESHISVDSDATTIRYGEFAYKFLDNIDIPDNIITIERNAFKGNKLTNVIIPPNIISIGEKAFAINRLKSITIGSDVSLVENSFGFGFEDVYKNNGSIAGTYTRTDAKSSEWSIWYDSFRYENHDGSVTITGYGGTSGGSVVIPSEINGNLVTSIGEEAFRDKWLESVTIPASVISIGNSAFRDNRLTRITIPNSVKDIGINAFAQNQIIRVSIGADVTLGDTSTEGILGWNTGFNGAYFNNNRREGVYTRPNTDNTKWARSPR